MNEPPFLERPIDQERLIYIHSNRFITSGLFHRKFFSDCTPRRAWKVLETYVSRGYLSRIRRHRRAESMYILTGPAIKALMEMGLVLSRRPQPVKLGGWLAHDYGLQALRMALEASPGLKDIWWVSGYELGMGISPEVKAEFQRGTLDIEAWRKTLPPIGHNHPDAYFEATAQDMRGSTALFYLDGPVYGRRLDHVTRILERKYTMMNMRLVVCREAHQVRWLARGLYRKVPWDRRSRYLLNHLDAALAGTFPQGWSRLERPNPRW